MKKKSSRIPRNYDGNLPTARPIKRLLPRIMRGIQEVCDEKPIHVLETWPKIVGERFASMTQAVAFEQGVLRVKVNNSTLYSILATHEKPRILTELRKRLPAIKIYNIVFTVG